MPVEVYTAIRKRRQDRHKRLVELGYPSYADYLRSEHWHHVRAAPPNTPSAATPRPSEIDETGSRIQ